MRHLALIVLLASLASGSMALAANGDRASAATRLTGKERLSDKASDEQRVDDCKVPPARRTRPRPTYCPWGVRAVGTGNQD